jgi:hypothetical protein
VKGIPIRATSQGQREPAVKRLASMMEDLWLTDGFAQKMAEPNTPELGWLGVPQLSKHALSPSRNRRTGPLSDVDLPSRVAMLPPCDDC